MLIVGGGLIGCATAWHLAKAGAQPLLIDSHFINAGASGQNAGSLHFQIERRFLEQDPSIGSDLAKIVRLNRLAIVEWAGLEEALGERLGIAMHGGLMLAEDEEEMALIRHKVEKEQAFGLGTELLDGTALRNLLPSVADSVRGAAFLAQEGHADPRILTDAFAAEAVRLGARMRMKTTLTGLRMARNGTYEAIVRDESGTRTISTRRLLLATGAWTTAAAAMLGLQIPLHPVPLTMSVTDRTGPILPYLVQHVGKRLSMKQTEHGNLLIGGGWPSRFARNEAGEVDIGRAPLADETQIRANITVAADVFPIIRQRLLIRSWTGITCISADHLPIVGMIDAAPGLYIAAGGSLFTLGPIIARLLSDLIVNGGPGPEIMQTIAPARFNHLNAFTVLP